MVDRTTDALGEISLGTSEVTYKLFINAKGCKGKPDEGNNEMNNVGGNNTNNAVDKVKTKEIPVEKEDEQSKTEETPEEKEDQLCTDPDNPLLSGLGDIRARIEAQREEEFAQKQAAAVEKKKAEEKSTDESPSEKGFQGKFLQPIYDDDGEIIGYKNPLHIGHLDLKVGAVITVERHPNPSKQSSYTEVIAVNPYKESTKNNEKFRVHFQDIKKIKEERNLVVESGIPRHYDINDILLQKVIVLCNIKPFTSRGVDSRVVVLCARKGKDTELLRPPGGADLGDPLVVKGYPKKPQTPYVLNISKVIEPDLRVNKDRQLVYKDKPVKVEHKEGFITTRTLSDCGVTNVMGYDFI